MLVVAAVLAVTVAAAVAVARRDARTRGAVIIRLVTMVVAETRTILQVARTYDGAGAVRDDRHATCDRDDDPSSVERRAVTTR